MASQEPFSMQVWSASKLLNPANEPSPSPIVALGDILSPVARHSILLNGEEYWLTMPLSHAVSALASNVYILYSQTPLSL